MMFGGAIESTTKCGACFWSWRKNLTLINWKTEHKKNLRERDGVKAPDQKR